MEQYDMHNYNIKPYSLNFEAPKYPLSDIRPDFFL